MSWGVFHSWTPFSTSRLWNSSIGCPGASRSCWKSSASASRTGLFWTLMYLARNSFSTNDQDLVWSSGGGGGGQAIISDECWPGQLQVTSRNFLCIHVFPIQVVEQGIGPKILSRNFCGSSVVSPVNFGIVTLSIAISRQEVGPLSDHIVSFEDATPWDAPVLTSGDATLVASGGEMLSTKSGVGAGAGVENANGTAVSPGSGDSFNWSSLTKLVFLKLISGSDSRSISYTISSFVYSAAPKNDRRILHHIRGGSFDTWGGAMVFLSEQTFFFFPSTKTNIFFPHLTKSKHFFPQLIQNKLFFPPPIFLHWQPACCLHFKISWFWFWEHPSGWQWGSSGSV